MPILREFLLITTSVSFYLVFWLELPLGLELELELMLLQELV